MKVLTRWGSGPNARRMRPTVAGPAPPALAMERVLQRVASRGIDSKVISTTRSTSASPILRGAPDRGSSGRPSHPDATNRRRHLPTVTRVVPNRSAAATSLSPAAVAGTIRARRADACVVFGRRTHRSGSLRSSAEGSGIARLRWFAIARPSHDEEATPQQDYVKRQRSFDAGY